MTSDEQDAIILSVFAEITTHRDDEMTAREIQQRSVRRKTPLSLTQVARRLPHLMRRGFVIEIPSRPGKWSATPEGLGWIRRG